MPVHASTRSITIRLNQAKIAETKAIFDALVPLGMGFVKVAAPVWEKRPSGQHAVIDCTCTPSSTTRHPPDMMCASIGKHPMGLKWEQHATQDWAIAERWLLEGFNLGFFPMPGCRIIGLDEDKIGALDALFALAGEHVPEFETMADVRGGKFHLYVVAPDGYAIDDLTKGRFEGGDVLRDGLIRQFVMPNGLHTGGRRDWNGVLTLKEASPALLAALVASGEALKAKFEAATTPKDPGWEVDEGNRHDFLLSNAGKLRNLGLRADAIYTALADLNDLRCKPPKSDDEVRKIARDYAKKDATGDIPPITLTINPNGHQPVPPGQFVTLAAYEPKAVDWLWDGWMPRAEPVILEGLGGEGKSTFVVDLMARLSRGDAMPDGATNPFGQPMRSIYITGEDDPNRVLAPRFLAARADMERILFWNTRFTMPSSLQALANAAAAADIALVFIDPLFSHIDPNINPNADSDIRVKIMDPIRQVAHLTDTTVLIARHLNKKSGDEIALRGSGSYGGLTGAARAVLHSMTDPDDDTKDTKLIGPIKANYSRLPKPHMFEIEEVVVQDWSGNDIFTTRIRWLGKHSKHLDAISRDARSVSATKGNANRHQQAWDQADADLTHILTPGPMLARDVQDEMVRRGHSRDRTYDARARCNVEVYRPHGPNTSVWWRLPPGPPVQQTLLP